MYKRKIIKLIDEWKESLKIKKRALVIKGLRQVGKTTIVREYCKNHYKNIVYINFMDNESIKNIFNGDLIVNNIIRDLSAVYPDANFICVDSNPTRIKQIIQDGFIAYEKLEDAVKENLAFAFVSTSPLSHATIIPILLKNKINTFTEINLSSKIITVSLGIKFASG